MQERRRQVRLAETRLPLAREAFVDDLIARGLSRDLSIFLADELQPYYFAPLTPYPTDRLNGDMKIDPDEMSFIAERYERRFGVRLERNPISCPDDPTIAEFGIALRDATRW